MSNQELDRAGIIQQVMSKQLTQKDAAFSLGLSDRQLRRLAVRYRSGGAGALAHAARGKPSNNQLDPMLLSQAMELVRTKYADFGPTFAAEKLQQLDGVRINHETLRKAMVAEGVWKSKKRKAVHRTRRERRACYGDMEQFDGCRHDWFEGRAEGGAWATLLACRDDANNLIRAQFVAFEGTAPVMAFWRDYFQTYGKPQSIYLDRHSTYKVNAKAALDDDTMLSQFGRAMRELGVQLIHANSPQAKGRIENLFGTLQDRLVKELRLANISDVSSANKFLQDVFLPGFNQRFAVVPASEADVHRTLRKDESGPGPDGLAAVLSVQSERLVNQDFTVRFKGQWLQLDSVQPTLVLPKKRVIVEERLDGSLSIRLNHHYLNFQAFSHQPVAPTKAVRPIALTSNPKPYTPRPPAAKHPWRKFTLNRQGNPTNTVAKGVVVKT